MLEESVKEACNSILCSSFGLVGKLVGIQLWVDDWEDGVQYQFLKAFCYYGGKCYWSVMISWGQG